MSGNTDPESNRTELKGETDTLALLMLGLACLLTLAWIIFMAWLAADATGLI
jgi:hypothetical protein